MNEIMITAKDWFDLAKGFLAFVTALGGSILAIKKWIKEPIEETNKKLGEVLAESQANDKAIGEKIDALEAVLQKCNQTDAMLLWDRIQSLHDMCMDRGFCPATEKRRILKMYYRYHNELGLNTLSEKYEEDILRLPESAETPGVAAADSERKPEAGGQE